MVPTDKSIELHIWLGFSAALRFSLHYGGHSKSFQVPSCLCVWLTIETFPTHPFLNIAFAVVFATSMYCFTQAVVSDPGYIPRPGGISEQKKIVEELVVRGELDARHFCTSCFVRKSLRSKHCRICDRCVARHDQYLLLLTKLIQSLSVGK